MVGSNHFFLFSSKEEQALPDETSTDELKESPARDLSSKDLMLLNQLLSKQQQQQQQQLQQQQQQQQHQQQQPQLQPLQQHQQQQQQKPRHSTDRFANQLLMGAAALQNHMQIAEGMPVQFVKGPDIFSEFVSCFSLICCCFSSSQKRRPQARSDVFRLTIGTLYSADKSTIAENGVSDSMYQSLLQSFSAADKRTACSSGMFSPERRDEILRTFIENAPKLSQGPGAAALPAHLVSRKRPNENEVLDFSTTPKLSNSHLASLATPNSGTNGVTKFDDDKLHASKPRVSQL